MDLGSQEFIDTAQSSRFLFVQGWLFRHSEGLSRNRDTICRYFRPISRIERVVEEVVDRARQRGQTLVGVHIRQGDYAKHLGGRYFFDLDTYLDKIQELADVLSDKDPVFLVSSDQPLSTESFKGLPVDLATGHFVSDLYSLASCDLLVGPPSSFTMWASFYGGTPLGFITDRRKRAPLPEEMDVFPTISDKQVHDLYLIS